MLKNKFKIKFTKDLIKYALIIFFLIALIYAVLSFSLIKYQQQIQITQLQHNASNINDRISTVFDYINNVNVFIGTQIVKSGGKDLNKIYDLFTDVKYHHDKYKNLFSWTLFDWVDENNLQLVNTKKGIAENPSDMSHREYTRTAKLRPWKLQASPPVIGNPSGEWVIPVGTGVIDDQQKYLGVIVLGININELFSKIKTSTDTNVEYLLIDKDYQIVDTSFNAENLIKLSQYEQLIIDSYNILNEPIRYNDKQYFVASKLVNYPYTILTGYSDNYLTQQYRSIILPRIIEFIIISFVMIFLLFTFRKKLIDPVSFLTNQAKKIYSNNKEHDLPVLKNSDVNEIFDLAKAIGLIQKYKEKLEAKNKELLKSNEILKKNEFVIARSDEIRENYFKDICKIKADYIKNISNLCEDLRKVLADNEVHNKFVTNSIIGDIESSAQDLFMLSSDVMKLEKVCLNDILQEAIVINEKKILRNEISLEIDIDKDLPMIKIDSQRIKQIFVGLLSHVILFLNNSNKPVKKLIIKAQYTKLSDTIEIEFIDNGDFKSEEQKIHLTKGEYLMYINRTAEADDLPIMSIVRLIRAHGGTLQVKYENGVNISQINLPINLSGERKDSSYEQDLLSKIANQA